MRRRGRADRAGGRVGRMRVWRVCGVVVRGEAMVRGRSGREVVKRIMRVRGGMEGGGSAGVGVVVVDIALFCFLGLYVCLAMLLDGGLVAVEAMFSRVIFG